MSNSVSISGILGIFGTISTLLLVLVVIGIMNDALEGDTEGVNEGIEKITEDIEEDVKWLPMLPFAPYIIGGVAVVLTSICALLGISLKFVK